MPNNFQFRIESKKINHYYSGKFDSFEIAQAKMERLQNKYSGAFIVAFNDNKLISIKKALGKM